MTIKVFPFCIKESCTGRTVYLQCLIPKFWIVACFIIAPSILVNNRYTYRHFLIHWYRLAHVSDNEYPSVREEFAYSFFLTQQEIYLHMYFVYYLRLLYLSFHCDYLFYSSNSSDFKMYFYKGNDKFNGKFPKEWLNYIFTYLRSSHRPFYVMVLLRQSILDNRCFRLLSERNINIYKIIFHVDFQRCRICSARKYWKQ